MAIVLDDWRVLSFYLIHICLPQEDDIGAKPWWDVQAISEVEEVWVGEYGPSLAHESEHGAIWNDRIRGFSMGGADIW